jgi:hypothetical protein
MVVKSIAMIFFAPAPHREQIHMLDQPRSYKWANMRAGAQARAPKVAQLTAVLI